MSRIISRIDTGSPAYRKNFDAMTRRVDELGARLQQARYERPQRDLERLAQLKTSCRCASAWSCCSIRARRSWNSRRAGRQQGLWRRRARGGPGLAASASSLAAR